MRNGWRTTAFVLGAVCSWQAWRSCSRSESVVDAKIADCDPGPRGTARSASDRRGGDRVEADSTAVTTAPPPSTPAPALFGIPIPSWARSLTPQPGEDLRAYRDRMIPLAQMVVAPHRARVAQSRDDIARIANLDAQQVAGLESTTKEAATAIQDRLFTAVLSGELDPSTFKPMAGVAVARDVLDVVDRANRKFTGSLREDQRTKLAAHPFDFADYLVFSTRWEDAISGL